MTETEHPVLCRCPGCKREAPADIDHWRREFGERPAPYAMREKILICPDCGNREVKVVNSWWEVELDETANWEIDAADKPDIVKITTVYLVNRAERTYLCTSQPSYWLRCVGFRVHLQDHVTNEAPDYRRDHLYTEYESAPEKESDGYRPCAEIDHLPAAQLHRHAEIELDSEDEVVEELAGNWWF